MPRRDESDDDGGTGCLIAALLILGIMGAVAWVQLEDQLDRIEDSLSALNTQQQGKRQ